MNLKEARWFEVLEQARRSNGVPGAALGVRVGGEMITVAAGVADIMSLRPVSLQTIFRWGSITKLVTAIAALKVAEAAAIDVDEPLISSWPDFPLKKYEIGQRISLSHLLSHTSGVFGDLFTDFGDGPDALRQYAVAAAEQLELIEPPGGTFSYCNAGFSLAARASEIWTGAMWDEIVSHQVLIPYGLTRTGTRPLDTPDDVAASHVEGDNGQLLLAPYEPPLRALAPAGATAWGSIGDLVKFVDGLVADKMLLNQMRRRIVTSPAPTFAFGWGLGLAQFDDDATILGHDGAVKGQQSFLRFRPEEGIPLALMTNGGDGRALFTDIASFAEKELGVCMQPPAPQWPRGSVLADASKFSGLYAVRDYAVEVMSSDDRLSAKFYTRGPKWDFDKPIIVDLRPDPADISGDLFLAKFPGVALPTHQRFHQDGNNKAEAFTFRGRRFPRIENR